MHRAYRSLNDPVKLLGFTALQWAALILTGAAAIGATQVVGLPVRPAITVCSVVITTVAAVAYASEPGGVQPLGLLADLVRMRVHPRHYPAGSTPATSTPTQGLLVTGTAERTDAATVIDRATEVFTA